MKHTKPLLIILLFLSTVCNGQKDTIPANAFIAGTSAYLTADSVRNYGQTFLTSGSNSVYDTSKCILVYIDTAFIKNTTIIAAMNSGQKIGEGVNRVPYIFWQFGYRVKIRWSYSEAWYLDADRRPLPKSLIIINTVEL